MHKTVKCQIFSCVRVGKSDGSEAAKGVGVDCRGSTESAGQTKQGSSVSGNKPPVKLSIPRELRRLDPTILNSSLSGGPSWSIILFAIEKSLLVGVCAKLFKQFNLN